MDNVTLIILGATGDLARRKLFPSIYRLLARNKLNQCAIIGAAYEEVTVLDILEKVRKHMPHIDEEVWQQLVDSFSYQQLNFNKLEDYKRLNSHIQNIEKQQGCPGNRLIYLAAASTFYCEITTNLAKSGIAHKTETKKVPWNRIVYEKPFGHDKKSAHEINACIKTYFDEHQIYRIDHYLTKELVSNISLLRFTNCVLEPLWNNRYIDNVQIILSEEICMEGRGAYFDAYGTLRDVMQNHMLELLALVAMEAPKKLTGEYVADQRVQVLKHVEIIDGILGQYHGYHDEPGVKPDSTTETFAALYAQINNPRWTGVPFYLKSGKCLNKKETAIYIKFKQVDCLLAKECPSETNSLTIRIAPDASFILRLNAKKVGESNELIPIDMEFCHSCVFGRSTPQSHEILLSEIIRGERSVSVRFDEIEYAWDIIDQIITRKLPVYEYEEGSAGPKELIDFEKKHGMRWRS